MQVKDAIAGAELVQFLAADIQRRATPASSGRPLAPGSSQRLEEWLRAAQESATAIGRMPPVSSTWRARVGEVLVRIVRRMLFWYTPQIVSFNTAAVGALRQLAADLHRLESHIAEPDLGPLIEQTACALAGGGIAILETANPEPLCAALEARGILVDAVRHGPRLWAVSARKPACES